MDTKILFVDDESSLLKAISRRLGFKYDLDTADSGQKALDMMLSGGSYGVIFTDMRMPQMDGVAFLAEAQKIAPDSVYVMLTGNNDQETAIRALNEGRVFRFLNKPCESEELTRAIEDACRQYQLVKGEKELLHNTFAGAIRALTDVVEVCQPELAGRSTSVEKKVDTLRSAMEIENRWEFRLAARLSLLGVALLPENEKLLFERGDHTSEAVSQSIEHSCQIASRLLSDIPRLDIIGKIFGHQSPINGAICSNTPESDEEVIQVGATLLRVATHWDFLSRQGLSASQLAQDMKAILPELHHHMAEIISETPIEELNSKTIELPVGRLAAGMVLANDIQDDAGALLLRQGHRLTSAMIEKLRAYDCTSTVEVTEVSVNRQERIVLC